jgi:hypothetical protein
MKSAIETITLRHATPHDEPLLRGLFQVNASAEFIAAGFSSVATAGFNGQVFATSVTDPVALSLR